MHACTVEKKNRFAILSEKSGQQQFRHCEKERRHQNINLHKVSRRMYEQTDRQTEQLVYIGRLLLCRRCDCAKSLRAWNAAICLAIHHGKKKVRHAGIYFFLLQSIFSIIWHQDGKCQRSCHADIDGIWQKVGAALWPAFRTVAYLLSLSWGRTQLRITCRGWRRRWATLKPGEKRLPSSAPAFSLLFSPFFYRMRQNSQRKYL